MKVVQTAEAALRDLMQGAVSTGQYDQVAVLAGCNSHLKRSRERFYCAEVLREFARDNLPEQFTFGDVQDQVFDGVIDTAEQVHKSG